MRHFPAFLDLQGRPAAIFGGGPAALAKTRLLMKASARVHVFSEDLDDDLAHLAQSGAIVHERVSPHAAARTFDPSRFALIVSCAGDPADQDVAARAKAVNIPVNVVDRTDLCGFITPSIVDRGDVIIAVSTAGESPVIARRLRERIEAMTPKRIGDLAALIGRNRSRVAEKLPAMADRRVFWEGIVDGPIAESMLAGDAAAAEAALEAAIARLPQQDDRKGFLHIVGAGPGDPDLLTLKALRLLQDADVIIHDVQISSDLLDLARRDADRIVARASHGEAMSRSIEDAVQGRRVVRLMHGESALSESDAHAARKAGIAFHVVPGLPAARGPHLIAAE